MEDYKSILENEINKLRTKLEQIILEKIEYNRQIELLKSQVNPTEIDSSTIKQLTQNIDSSRNRELRLRQELSQLENKLHLTSSSKLIDDDKIKELSSKLSNKDHEIENLETKLLLEKEKIKDLESKINLITQTYNSNKIKSNEEIEILRTKLIECEQEILNSITRLNESKLLYNRNKSKFDETIRILIDKHKKEQEELLDRINTLYESLDESEEKLRITKEILALKEGDILFLHDKLNAYKLKLKSIKLDSINNILENLQHFIELIKLVDKEKRLEKALHILDKIKCEENNLTEDISTINDMSDETRHILTEIRDLITRFSSRFRRSNIPHSVTRN